MKIKHAFQITHPVYFDLILGKNISGQKKLPAFSDGQFLPYLTKL